jgi:hypothetical protein
MHRWLTKWVMLALLPVVLLGIGEMRSGGALAEPDLTALARARIEAAHRAYQEALDLYREGRSRDVDRIYLWSVRWLEAERDAAARPADQLPAWEAHTKRMKQLDDLVRGRFRAGVAAAVELPAVEYYRKEADFWLARARRP